MSEENEDTLIILDEHPDILSGKRKLANFRNDIIVKVGQRHGVDLSKVVTVETTPETQSAFQEIYNSDEYYNDSSFVQLPWGGYYTKLAGDKDEDLLGVGDSNIIRGSGNLDFAALARQQKYSMLQYRDENGDLVFQEDDRKCRLCNRPIMVVDHVKKEAHDNLLFERQVYTHGSVIKQCFCEDCAEKEVYLADGAWFPDVAEMYLRGGGHVETADSHEYNLRFLWFGDPPF